MRSGFRSAGQDDDPRRPIQRGLTYLSNNLQRADYPHYRRMGLPVTSTLMESLGKEFNLRVKGTENLWTDPQAAEAIPTVRAELLSEHECFAEFFATRPGFRYRRRGTLKRENAQAKLATASRKRERPYGPPGLVVGCWLSYGALRTVFQVGRV